MPNKLNCAYNWISGFALGFDWLYDYWTVIVYLGCIEVILYWGNPEDYIFTDMIFNPDKYEEAHYEATITNDKDSTH